ncbi:hypothetical protein A3A39_00180 [Candidatus Kaiserbacteria bacterium RIFCSPLOWO2_01_FULL_54_13]|uniref:t-SNARE coiled-coil homology domain-containing protein n=1 Tax=Candidatus Kaiserbacteria bacterium RIFCSPLOWO2_01_FULL_54_13 TaxID=1798512 RepID=A0A1F6F3R0_9BACT|nr:MAG: hypothetical protein A3A39_00180 [Candidatus Kaiserbacteria bacterium RIFCSPLOWO2_01_FULL_54_13]
MARKHRQANVNTIEGLAGVVAEGFADVNERFDEVDERFDKVDKRFDTLELEITSGFEELRKVLGRIETRLAALELAVFGAPGPEGGRLASRFLLSRLDKLEKAVFGK